MRRPRVLDLFCGPGGAGMGRGKNLALAIPPAYTELLGTMMMGVL